MVFTGQASNTVKQKAREINDLTVLLACLFYLEGDASPGVWAGGQAQKKGRPRSLPPIGEIFRVFYDF